MDRNGHMATRTPVSAAAQANEFLRRSQAADGLTDLLVDFITDLGPNCQPLHKVRPGTTVTATVHVEQLHPARGGRARGILTGSGGRAIFTIDSAAYEHLAPVLTQGTHATIRGTVAQVGATKTISIRAARTAVTA